jgi:hypothetical protein
MGNDTFDALLNGWNYNIRAIDGAGQYVEKLT